MRRIEGLSGAALTLLLGIVAAGCAPKEEPAAPGPVTPAQQTSTDSTAAAGLQTVTLKAVGMT